MKLNAIRAFVTVARGGSVTRAATAVFRTQSNHCAGRAAR
ncbi:LysR family transcriptional regulator [Bradyrhizobium sp. CCBAU 21362]|nr:LysR family transcriptional regulator [Bradyrhizobium sp. CCBAU 21362]